ncbi:hypothetical protein ACFFVB_01505 [Formosa undariae]|uniref:Uncharacterized protein n=1 Tax=Formosa undariae TaxID=1325436 RepID=A0ABV5EX35_9FLAO
MKAILIVLVLFLVGCSAVKSQTQNDNSMYFFFDSSKKEEMVKYHSYPDGPIRYLYKIENVNNIIFTTKNDITVKNYPERVKLTLKDTSNLKMKDYKWLKAYMSNWRNKAKLRHSGDDMFIIEKDTIDSNLYLINVIYIEETP